MLTKAQKDEKYWKNYYKRKLLNILAIVHRDGGDYTASNGVEKSVTDAMAIISKAVVR